MINCPYCQEASTLFSQNRDYNQKISNNVFDYYYCPNCRLIFITPIPKNLDDYYPKSYYSRSPTLKQLVKSANRERYKIALIQKFVTSGRLLEIGPAYGSFCWLAKQAGFEVEAIEMEASCCKFLSTILDIKTFNSADIIHTLHNQKPYQVVALWHVIEHLPDPWGVLEAIREKIPPGGIILIATPNPKSIQFKIMKKFWPHVDAPRHLMLIPAELLIQKMNSLGFKTVLLTTKDKGSLDWNTFGWKHFFSNMSSFRLLKAGLRMIGFITSILLIPFEKTEGKGSAYTAIFMREK